MRPGLFVLSLLLLTTAASADMVEIKGEGIFNGTIESEDKDQVTFREAGGKLRTLARKDILFMERQTDSPVPQKVIQKASDALKKIVPAKAPAKRPTAPAKKKASSSPSSAGGGGDSTGALSAIARAQRAVNENNARVEKNLRDGDAISEAKEKTDAHKGKFGSL